MTIEVIVNPIAGIATALILLVSVTAITFIAILLLCGVRTEDILDDEGKA
jgi:hypothetical protein